MPEFSLLLRRLGLGAATALATCHLPAQAQISSDTTFQRLLRTHQYTLTQTGARLAGPGWDKLQQDIRQSTVVLLGEDHGTAQIPPFAQAVAAVLNPRLYVAEIDRYQAQDVSRLAAQPGLPTAFSRRFPMALSFYSWVEEFELARSLQARGTALLGIEQAGFASTGRLLALLADQTSSKSARAYVRRQAAAIQAHDRAVLVSGAYENITINHLRPALLDSLRRLMRSEPPAAQMLLQDLAASAAIFRTNAAGLPGGHQARINLMRRNLLRELQPYQLPQQALPPMLFKFGAYHMGRGRSIWGDVYDVGNLMLNLAEVHDQKTLHIFIIGKQGTQVGGQHPEDFSKNVTHYSNADAAMVRPFMAATPNGTDWQVFDVRPLRRALLREGMAVGEQELQATILGFDYVVVIPETTASRNF
ncbi:hypothetical protein [Hymenobacter metallilatus]|uniref:Erythromycin esterase family protein n=1 Tax=Hymenobacter metallilatus TaxID=2493666 RepID=A0A428IY97_9BACT|nr:hypothetical protein [Hymenobacter metallilatus]RSK24091.1 hypothetical protein EI290_21080 [Hymenobacter metallilatus]